MGFQILGSMFFPVLEWPERWEAILVLAIYAAGLLTLWVLRWRDFLLLRWQRLLLFLALLLVAPVLNSLFVLSISPPGLLPPPYLAAEPLPPALPLLGLLPVVVAAVWTGVGPAAMVGLTAGLFRAGATDHTLFSPFVLAFYAALAAYLLHQDYRGRLASVLRQPLIVLPLSCMLVWPLALFATFIAAYRPGGAIAAMDYSWTLQKYSLGLGLLEALGNGLWLQLLYFWRQVRPVQATTRPPPYSISLSRRFLFALTPIFLLTIGVLIYAVLNSAVATATDQAMEALVRDAANGAEAISSFVSNGQSLIRQFASDPALWGGDTMGCQERLRSDLQMLPYFSRLTAYPLQESEEVTATLVPLCSYPPTTEAVVLTDEEHQMLEVAQATGALMTTPVHRGLDGEVYISFLSPIEDARTGERYGTLVGRVDIQISPLIADVLSSLQQTMGRGEGFVVDENGHIVAHQDADRLLETWVVDQSRPPLMALQEDRGWVRQAYDSRSNARQMVCYYRVDGYPWAVVLLLPYEIVLSLAISIATPLLVLLLVLMVILSLVVLLVANQLTRPLNLLADAAGRIAMGNLDIPVHVAGDDEVARLGSAFEQMRVRLKGRLDDLSLLLRVSQQVSAALDLARGIPPLLEGALQGTGASVARVVLLSASGEPQVAMGRGQSVEGIGMLDRALALGVCEGDRPLLFENLSRARSIADFRPPSAVQAAIALPVRGRGRAAAIMWVGYPEPHHFDPTEVDLLSTLASQAAVLVENARLFQMAEGGRQQLAAILASTRDAVLVTDRDDCLVLINPAAEQALNLMASEVMGRRVSEAPLEPTLAAILTEPLGRGGALVREVPLPNGRTFYASVSTILSSDGKNTGRVVVLRDITYFKELDEMKSEFVATVSHDLRAPLTFMRGYATMLPMVGSLSEKQQEYLDKIMTGIEQMATLVEDLLNLGRIEAGVGLEKSPCHIGAVVVEAVDGMRARAAAKGLTLRMEASDPAPVILGDAALLRQAVANLVDNAIKYTPSGGTVTVGLRATPQEVFINVTDTGIGIAQEDQVRLFEKFFRIHRRESENVVGTGLGLAIVKSIVERHGGRVSVESVLNEGSTFTIVLPITAPVTNGQRQ
jgi:PAS domain S-box-containing protein